ncbi:MAG: 2-phospho-L-lactate transferase CofD family protein, partial [Terriglobales bacterium]
AIRDADAVLIAPSNPVTSIGPILSVPGIREALRESTAQVAAVSPIVGNAAVSGPAGELMKAQHLPVSIAGVAQAYADFLDILIADTADRLARVSNPCEVRIVFTNTIMSTDDAKTELARVAIASVIPAGALKPQ